jgi:phenylalanyl-tRNA synthetase beta chain
MRLLVSWLREFVDVTASAEEIGEGLGLRGFALEGIEPFGDGDAVIDFEITANRPDCLSVLGLAREVATLYDLPLKPTWLPQLGADATQDGDVIQGRGDSVGGGKVLRAGLAVPGAAGPADFQISIDDSELCPRYAVGLAEVAVAASPAWLTSRLQAAGVRSISSIVDITNYVLIELGHPTHAFDLEKLAGPAIRVRRAAPDERLTTLDGIARRLDADMLVIADRDRAQAVAGVMGGGMAEVSATTRMVAFESAYFKPASVRRTSKRLGLKTEASSRFERGADINAPLVALRRIEALLHQIGAGRLVAPLVDVQDGGREPVRLHLRRARLATLLGAQVPDRDVERILSRLGLQVTAISDGWSVVAPTARVDLQREVDLVEEVGRHYGFDQLPATFPVVTAPASAPDPRLDRDQLARRVLTAAGLSEAVTFGIIDATAVEAFVGEGRERPIAVANPLSAKFDTLRPSLLPGLVDAVAHNRRHGRDDVGLFEVGTRFSRAGETRGVALAWTGAATTLHWSGGAREVDFFDIKGVVEQLCRALGVATRYAPSREPFLVPGQTAAVLAGEGTIVGVVGQLLPSVADARGLPRQDRVFVAELSLEQLSAIPAAGGEATRSLPRYPFVVRDLSIVVADTLPAEIIRDTIQSVCAATPAPLTGVTFFDRYQGKGIAEGAVSLSVRMTFQAADRTLTDADVQASVESTLDALKREHGAVQR